MAPQQKSSKKSKVNEELSQELQNIRRKGELDIETFSLLQSLSSKSEDLESSKTTLLNKIKSRINERNDTKTTNTIEKVSVAIPVSRIASHGNGNTLRKLKSVALRQGAEEMAKLFGYQSHQEQKDALSKLDLRKRNVEEKGKEISTVTPSKTIQMEENDEENDEEYNEENDEEYNEENNEENACGIPQENVELVDKKSNLSDSTLNNDTLRSSNKNHDDDDDDNNKNTQSDEESVVVDDEESVVVDDEESAVVDDEEESTVVDDDEEESVVLNDDDDDENLGENKKVNNSVKRDGSDAETSRDKSSRFRALLEDEQKRLRRKKSKGGSGFIEQEAEEEEEENVLEVKGLGNFGFGVPSAKDIDEKDDDEKIAPLEEDDLSGIVDQLSDGEQSDMDDEYYAKNEILRDSAEIKQVMKNVREGFGRNRRAFSGGDHARGKFGLDELLAADGSKEEAARLGLLESDEELSEGEHPEDEENDEEARMERELRERFLTRPNSEIYLSSSEEEDEEDEMQGSGKDEEKGSDEERESEQMKSFSEHAKMNRRLKRLGNRKENNKLLSMEDDEESQEMVRSMKYTNTSKWRKKQVETKRLSSKSILSHSSLFMQAAVSMRVVSSTSSNSSKGFVFTSATEQQDDKENLTTASTSSSSSSSKKRQCPSNSVSLAKKLKRSSSLLTALSRKTIQ